MSVQSARNNVARILKDIANLEKKDASEAKNESRHFTNYNRANTGAVKTSSLSVMQNKLREAERHNNSMIDSQNKRAKIREQISRKTSELHRYQNQLETAQRAEIKKQDKERDRKLKEAQHSQDNLERRQKKLQQSMRLQNEQDISSIQKALSTKPKKHDVFISHASEDKDSFVRDFANRLKKAGLEVWYDEFSLSWGDSLRQSIDNGLANSKFGIVILSNNFFAKEWPQAELNGLFSMELSGISRILPVWHKITKDEVAANSPMLADKLAMNTATMTINEIVVEVVKLK